MSITYKVIYFMHLTYSVDSLLPYNNFSTINVYVSEILLCTLDKATCIFNSHVVRTSQAPHDSTAETCADQSGGSCTQ